MPTTLVSTNARGPVDRAVDVRLGGEVHHRARTVRGEEPVHERRVADVAAHEAVARVAAHRLEVAEVAGVGELVEVHHRLATRGEPVDDEVGADESGAAGDEDHGLAEAIDGATRGRRRTDDLTIGPVPCRARPADDRARDASRAVEAAVPLDEAREPCR